MCFLKYYGPRCKITLTGEARTLCPITKEKDYYTWRIIYTPRDELMEVIWLRKTLDDMKSAELTAEALAVLLKEAMDLINPYMVEVMVWDDSQGIQLEVII